MKSEQIATVVIILAIGLLVFRQYSTYKKEACCGITKMY